MAKTTTLGTVTSADGTEIAFDHTGSGPPLLLVHGSTADRARWEPVLPAFAEQFSVYAMDRRGRGGSGDVQQTPSTEPTRTFGSGDAGEYELEREYEDVVAVVDAIDEPVNLLGHSYGAICALEAALRTDDLRTLVLYEPPLPVGDRGPDSEPVLAEMEELIEDGDREEALVRFFRDVAGVPPAELDALRSAPNWPARVEAVHTVVREERTRWTYEFDPDRLAALAVPTLLLLGGETAPLFVDATAALDDALPDSRVVVLDGQAHAAMNTAPELFADEVLAFLSETN